MRRWLKKAWLSDIGTSFTIQSGIDPWYLAAPKAVWPSTKVTLPYKACTFRNIGSSRNIEGCRYRSRKSKASRCWNKRSKIKRSKRSSLESKSRSSRPQGQDMGWRINRWENLIIFLIVFSLPTNKIYLLNQRKVLNLFWFISIYLCTWLSST